MSKKIIILVSFLVLVIGSVFIILLSNTCNSYSGLIPMKEQRCHCVGFVWDPFPRGPADDGPDSDMCLGIITEKSYIDKRLLDDK